VKITDHPDLDILRILLSDNLIEENDESNPGTILAYDSAGNLVIRQESK